MSDRQSLFAAIEVDLDNWARYAVLSDWLGENGEADLALAFRWCWANRDRPRQSVISRRWLCIDPDGENEKLRLLMLSGHLPEPDLFNRATFEAAMRRIAAGLQKALAAGMTLRFEPEESGATA